MNWTPRGIKLGSYCIVGSSIIRSIIHIKKSAKKTTMTEIPARYVVIIFRNMASAVAYMPDIMIVIRKMFGSIN